jgi:hypothetical protein
MDLVDSLQFTVWERKRKNPGKEINAEFAESAEDAEKSKDRSGMGIKNGELAALDRKSPPFAKFAKDGAPSSTVLGCCYLEDQFGDSL